MRSRTLVVSPLIPAQPQHRGEILDEQHKKNHCGNRG